MKILIDGDTGYWRVFIETTPDSGVFKEMKISECVRIAIRTDPKQGEQAISFVRREYNYVESQPNDQG